MSRLDDTIHEEEAQLRESHLPLDYLVSPDGYSHRWVCCPFCEAVPDGWTPSGVALYHGGYVTVQHPNGSEALYACRCEVGNQRSKHTRFFTEAPPVSHFPRPVPAILHVRGERGQGQAPQPPKVEKADEYVSRIGEQHRRFMRGDLSLDQFNACCQALNAMYLPEPLILPRVRDVMESAALWGLYFGRGRQTGSEGLTAMAIPENPYQREKRKDFE